MTADKQEEKLLDNEVSDSGTFALDSAIDNGNDDDDIEVEENLDVEGENYYPVEYSITSYGADYLVDGLVKRLKDKNIFIPPFQRSYVWNIYRASRFVESLLLGLPVPAIFLSREIGSPKMLVIDGQQRLRTLQYFYGGVFGPTERSFRLKGVQKEFAEKTYETLNADDRLRLDDSIIHAIIIKQDEPQPEEEGPKHPSSIYHIFERLNTGGMTLHPQEIRSCLYHGPFVELLEELNGDASWRELFGKTSRRMRDRELILRFFALLYESDSYTKPMKEFLNEFLRKHRSVDKHDAANLSTLFAHTTKTILEALGESAFKLKRTINAALCDAVMVGVGSIVKDKVDIDYDAIKQQYDRMRGNDDFLKTVLSGTTDENSVEQRMKIAKSFLETTP